MTESISKNCLHSIFNKSYLSPIPEILINNFHYVDPVNEQKPPENTSTLTTIYFTDIQAERLTSKPAILSLRIPVLSRHSQSFSKINQESSISLNSPSDLTSCLEVSENLHELVLDNSPSITHDIIELVPQKNFPYTESFYERIKKYLADCNLYAIDDPLAFSQNSTFNKKISLFKLIQSSQSLAIQSLKSKEVTPSILVNCGELTLGSIKDSSIIKKRCMIQKANSLPEDIQNSNKIAFRSSMPPLSMGKDDENNSLKEITIEKISSNSFPGLNMKNGYLAEENYEEHTISGFSSLN